MNAKKAFLATTAAVALGVGTAGTAHAAPGSNAVNQSGGAAGGLVAAVVQAGNVEVVEIGDVTLTDVDVVDIDSIAIENVLNNNDVVQDVLNQNDVDVEDVVNIAIVDNVLVLVVDVL